MSRIKNTKLELNVDQIKILKRVFSLYSDKSGILDLKEILGAMREAEFDSKFPIVYDLIVQINASEFKNGIKFEQLIDEINKKLEDRESEESVERSFSYFIGNSQKEKIGADDIKRVADELGEELTDDQAGRIVSRIAKNGKNVDFDEFYTVMTKKTKL